MLSAYMTEQEDCVDGEHTHYSGTTIGGGGRRQQSGRAQSPAGNVSGQGDDDLHRY